MLLITLVIGVKFLEVTGVPFKFAINDARVSEKGKLLWN
jgi:hypothetical protein